MFAAPSIAPTPSSPHMVPRRNATVRYKSRPVTLVPFRDDTRLVALRYDQTVQAKPPIPIPPPRSPRRQTPSLPPISCVRVAGPTPRAVVEPPPRPPPPAEQHPALRTITTFTTATPRTNEDAAKRDSGHGTTVSSHFSDDSDDDDDEDPFAYDRIDTIPKVVRRRTLQLKNRCISPSLYSEKRQRSSESNSAVSDTFSSPALSDSGNTVSPASPVTPPPSFTKKFGKRSFSLRSYSSKTARDSMNRLKKKSLIGDRASSLRNPVPTTDTGYEHGHSRDPTTPGTHGTPGPTLGSPLDWSPNSPRSPNGADPSGNVPPSSDPNSSLIISTSIPTDSLLEDDFMTQLSFSKRGSLIFGGKRPRKHRHVASSDTMATMTNRDSGIGNDHDADKVKEARSFPLVPSANKSPPSHPIISAQEPTSTQSRHDDGDAYIVSSTDVEQPSRPLHPTALSPGTEAVTDSPSTPRLLPPSIRLISAEVEKESQKVRSLYESGEGLNWEDGERHPSLGERVEPTEVVPSDVDENDSQNDQAGRPTLDSASTSSLHDNTVLRQDHELAGGVEDWEGVDGQDVDRYGFILPPRPESRPTTPSESISVKFSPSKRRNILSRKDAMSPRSLAIKRGPTKKGSARSLNTQTSEFSTTSRRSTRSTIRQAANLLPHNKDRKLVDEAGDLLASQPGGLNHISEDESAEKMAAALRGKEAKRSEKWRKMAKVVKPGQEGQGMSFEFDVKNPKLVSRTWKGIPDCWRSAAWYSFLASSAKASQQPFATDEEIKADFYRLLEEPSPDDAQIDMDVPRTINQHIMFRRRYRGGQRLLFRVLHSLSIYFPATGYVQGMAPLAATFLSYYDEEACFVMLVRLWLYRGLNRIYQDGFEELIGALKDFEKHWLGGSLLGGKDVAEKLDELCIDPTAYATRWYLTLFNLSIPFGVQLRIWDVFILLGSSQPDTVDIDITKDRAIPDHPSSKGLEILHATSLAIIDALRPNLLDSDFENAMKALTSWIPIKDEQGFLDVVRSEWKHYQSKQKKIKT